MNYPSASCLRILQLKPFQRLGDRILQRRGRKLKSRAEFAVVHDKIMLELVRHLNSFAHLWNKQSSFAEHALAHRSNGCRKAGSTISYFGKLSRRNGVCIRYMPGLSVGILLTSQCDKRLTEVVDERIGVLLVQVASLIVRPACPFPRTLAPRDYPVTKS